jgi:hypothetical protein
MAGFLGGSSGSGGGGEILFPAEFIDPVTKLRVSEPETLIDTDFEYGLQPTKWETVELINNTPSFFSKSGDTTINGILAMVTTATSREVKVTTQDNHNLAVGIPINVSGTKSITADGSYIINSIPDPKSFTYLAKQNQDFTASIFDLYTSIITGEFFQGSQIKISDSQGIVTNAGSPSALTVQTDSPHGFQVGTPFYFLNLNSTVSQQFDASNTGAKTFDSSNSATAQTFDGSNTLTSYTIDLQNKGLTGGATSTTATHNTTNKTITVTHGGIESFSGRKVGTPLYYNVSAASGYLSTNPRGIVYLATTGNNVLGGINSVSTFSISSTPGGDALDIPSFPNGTFQLANQVSLFAGNNTDLVDQVSLTLTNSSPFEFDASNTLGSVSTVNTYSGTIIQLNNDAGTTISPNLYVNAMVLYTTTGTAASGLVNNTTYFVTYYNEPAGSSVPGFFQIKVAGLPGGADITVSGGTGTQKFRKIGVSLDKDIFHVPLHSFTTGDMVKYTYPSGGAAAMTNRVSDYIYVGTVYDTYNVNFNLDTGLQATGGTITEVSGFKYHAFTTVGTSSFVVTGGEGTVEVLVVAGGGGGGGAYGSGGGGGAGGLVYHSAKAVTSGSYEVVVGDGGTGGASYTGANTTPSPQNGQPGSNSSFGDIVALGGGGGNMSFYNPSDRRNGGSGGGGGDYYTGVTSGAWIGGNATQGNSGGGLGYGNPGGSRGPGGPTTNEDGGHATPHEGAGGGGAGGVPTGGTSDTASHGGIGRQYTQFSQWGSPAGWFAGGGGGGHHGPGALARRTNPPGTGGAFGGGGRGTNEAYDNASQVVAGEPGVSNTGGGGGGGARNYHGIPANFAAKGGSGIVVLRYQI